MKKVMALIVSLAPALSSATKGSEIQKLQQAAQPHTVVTIENANPSTKNALPKQIQLGEPAHTVPAARVTQQHVAAGTLLTVAAFYFTFFHFYPQAVRQITEQ